MISVIIPCYNHAEFLGEAIESVLSQRYDADSHEIIVVDDGSTDRTNEVAKRWPVQYLRQTQRGLASARNAGFRESKGEYVVFLDADDRLLPNHFQESRRAFEKHPNAGLVYGSYRFFGGGKGVTPPFMPVQDCEQYIRMLRYNFIGAIHCVMFRRETIESLGGFDSGLRASEDWDLYLRLLRGGTVSYHCNVIAEYRRYPEQMSRQWDRMLASSMSVLRKQWFHVRNDESLQSALKEGVRRCQDAFGEPLKENVLASLQRRNLLRAVRYLTVLFRYYPQCFVSYGVTRYSRLLEKMKQVLGF